MSSQYIIGIDLGATTAKIGIVNCYGTIIDRATIRSNTTNNEFEFINLLIDSINSIKKKNNIKEIDGIGIGAPNGNFLNGSIEFAQNTSWGRDKIIPLCDLISKYTGYKCLLTNDANAAAMGEMIFGATKGMSDFIEITLGTGLGAGVVIDKKILYGSNGMAGELGHYKINHQGELRLCSCGSYGCLEAYCSATGIVHSALEVMSNKKIKTTLKNYDIDNITAEIVYNEAIAKDAISIEIYANMGKLLGQAFADFVAFFAPQMIVIFGGMAKAKELFYPNLLENFNKNLLPIYKNKIQVVFSALPEYDVAILGASRLFI